MREQFNRFLQKVWPQRCLLCDSVCLHEIFLCHDCETTLPWQPPSCIRCATKLPDHADFVLCTTCLMQTPPFHSTTALFQYEPPISQFILKLKFQSDLRIAQLFSHYWIDYLKKYRPIETLPACLMPVPLHHKRLSERGFNQALEIAKPISRYFRIPIDIKSCVRIRHTEAQAMLPLKKRRNNLKNAFALSHVLPVKHVAIIDDVMTTSNTVSEISQLLTQSGVEHIEVWCCARSA